MYRRADPTVPHQNVYDPNERQTGSAADDNSRRMMEHSARVARDLATLGLPARNWPVPHCAPDGTAMHDVVVIGAGMCGIAAAASLMFKGIRNIAVLDAAPAGQEGPWVTTARMLTLRSPKQLPGIALGIPSLSFRAWYIARWGEAAWEALYKIANADWMAYLTWLRDALQVPVHSGVELRAIRPAAASLTLDLAAPAAPRTLHARRVILATGRAGAGGLSIPDWIDRDLWPDRAAHTAEDIDFTTLVGRSVAVIGAGASAWDNAATALEHGAMRVDMYVRRRSLPQINKGRGSAGPGFFEGWPALSDAERWQLLVYLADIQAPPPHETVLRTIAHGNFSIHFASPVAEARRTQDGVALKIATAGATRAAAADFLIVGTGFKVDLAARPELAELAPHLATWADAYAPPPTLLRPDLGRYPYLGAGFELVERVAGSCPAVARVHLFNHAAFASMGAIASDIPGVSTGAERLSSRIAQAFFAEDLDPIRAELEAFAEPELENTPFFMPDAFASGRDGT